MYIVVTKKLMLKLIVILFVSWILAKMIEVHYFGSGLTFFFWHLENELIPKSL